MRGPRGFMGRPGLEVSRRVIDIRVKILSVCECAVGVPHFVGVLTRLPTD